jgi:hypothetical protein
MTMIERRESDVEQKNSWNTLDTADASVGRDSAVQDYRIDWRRFMNSPHTRHGMDVFLSDRNDPSPKTHTVEPNSALLCLDRIGLLWSGNE